MNQFKQLSLFLLVMLSASSLISAKAFGSETQFLASDMVSGMQPKYLDAHKVSLNATSSLRLLNYELTVWPSSASFAELVAHLESLEDCLIFQSDSTEHKTDSRHANSQVEVKRRQISCANEKAILSAYATKYGVFWSEAWLESQKAQFSQGDSDFSNTTVMKNGTNGRNIIDRKQTQLVSEYSSGAERVITWISDRSIDDLQQQELRLAQGKGWRITAYDQYTGSFVLAKENHSIQVFISGWEQDDGRIFITEVTQKKP
ncbi:hypothetical protein CWE08_06580 [Aliidiomarina iranensis]|uniref:Uncharacterized protein n=1 Tax=Aliidiomarina iranensis TaxID=1434071 RepID=A0A432VX42_9GAMM|nr:hypothetical protein [Aliidiomarina iranensis]RUO21242.1 hypothetical protein CWE08_06580 [Aliidiomarina iranensis]